MPIAAIGYTSNQTLSALLLASLHYVVCCAGNGESLTSRNNWGFPLVHQLFGGPIA